MIESVLIGAIRSGTSVLFASLGENISEKAGIVNLGTEGSMLIGAMTAFAITSSSGNPWLGLGAGAAAGGLLALVHAFLVIQRGANQLASGLTVMFLAQGLTAYFGREYVSKQIDGFDAWAIPGLSSIPVIGNILFNHDPITYLSVILVGVVTYIFYRTQWGLVLRSTGERPDVVFANGYRPARVQYLAVLAGGALAGLGGAQLSTAFTMNWVEGMTQGRGLVAVALVIFAGWRPIRVAAAAYLFGGAVALQLTLQANGYGVSPFLMSMIPYVLTLVVFILITRGRRSSMPEALSKVFSGSS